MLSKPISAASACDRANEEAPQTLQMGNEYGGFSVGVFLFEFTIPPPSHYLSSCVEPYREGEGMAAANKINIQQRLSGIRGEGGTRERGSFSMM